MEEIINLQTFPIKFRRNKSIASPFEKNHCTYLLLDGAIHGFLKVGTKHITTRIATEGEFVGPFIDLTFGPSEEYIEAISTVSAIAIPHETMIHLYNNFTEANIIGRMLAEVQYREASERATVARLPSAKLRYERFLVSYQHLIERIPLRYIASFLGMRLETLSRLRTEMAYKDRK